MLSITAATVQFYNTFTLEILVSSESVDPSTGDPVSTPSTDVPTVTADYIDSGVMIETSTGTVTITGKYTSIIPITWHWLDLDYQPQSASVAPEAGTYSKITKVDSPPFLSKDCTYTIDSLVGSDTFVHTVTLSSYSTIGTALRSLVAGTPP